MLRDAELHLAAKELHLMAMPVVVPRYTLRDLETFPDDGSRYELLAGAPDESNHRALLTEARFATMGPSFAAGDGTDFAV